MNYHLVPIFITVFLVPAHAGVVQQAIVDHRTNHYRITLDMVVDADQQAVHAIVTDYDHLDRISDMLVTTKLIPGATDNMRRRRLVMQSCILIFCFKITMVEDIAEIDGETSFTTIVPELSDFKSGVTEWHVTAVSNDRSRILLSSDLEPDFWVPPVIGPFLIKRKMRSEAKHIIDRIEYLAGHE